MASTYIQIASVTTTVNQEEVTFSSIPSTYTDLVLVANFTSDQATPYKIKVGNGSVDTNSNYSNQQLIGDGASPIAGRVGNQAFFNAGYIGSSARAMTITHFLSYSSTSIYKPIIHEFRTAASSSYSIANITGTWRSFSPISAIQIITNQSPQVFLAGATFTLYGIKAGNV